MQAWLMALAKKLIYDLVAQAWSKLLAYLKQKKKESDNKKEVEKIDQSSASDKPHAEKVQDAKDFLNNINKP